MSFYEGDSSSEVQFTFLYIYILQVYSIFLWVFVSLLMTWVFLLSYCVVFIAVHAILAIYSCAPDHV